MMVVICLEAKMYVSYIKYASNKLHFGFVCAFTNAILLKNIKGREFLANTILAKILFNILGCEVTILIVAKGQ